MENIEFRKGAVDAANCISEGWNFVKPNYWLFFAICIVSVLISAVASRIPYAGSVINIVVGGALTCGIYIALLAQWRRQNVQFSLMFEGFSRILQTTLITLVAAIPSFIFAGLVYAFVPIPDMALAATNPQAFIEAFFNRAVILPLAILTVLSLVVSIVVQILMFFALPLVADRNVAVGDALRLSLRAGTSNFGGLLALVLFQILLCMAGLLVCVVGVFFVLPVVFASRIVAYKSVFPEAAPQFNNEPPRPDQYGGTYGTPQ